MDDKGLVALHARCTRGGACACEAAASLARAAWRGGSRGLASRSRGAPRPLWLEAAPWRRGGRRRQRVGGGGLTCARSVARRQQRPRLAVARCTSASVARGGAVAAGGAAASARAGLRPRSHQGFALFHRFPPRIFPPLTLALAFLRIFPPPTLALSPSPPSLPPYWTRHRDPGPSCRGGDIGRHEGPWSRGQLAVRRRCKASVAISEAAACGHRPTSGVPRR